MQPLGIWASASLALINELYNHSKKKKTLSRVHIHGVYCTHGNVFSKIRATSLSMLMSWHGKAFRTICHLHLKGGGAQMASKAENVSIWWRHHECLWCYVTRRWGTGQCGHAGVTCESVCGFRGGQRDTTRYCEPAVLTSCRAGFILRNTEIYFDSLSWVTGHRKFKSFLVEVLPCGRQGFVYTAQSIQWLL